MIDADALIKQVKAIHKAVDASRINTDFDTGFHSATSQIMGLIAYMPTIEDVPVVHGEWLRDGDFLICLNCESEMNIKNSLGNKNKKNFCPNCGADMRKKV